MILLTANRSMKGEDSLEQVLREENRVDSLPVITLIGQYRRNCEAERNCLRFAGSISHIFCVFGFRYHSLIEKSLSAGKVYVWQNLKQVNETLKTVKETTEAGKSLWQTGQEVFKVIAPWLGVAAKFIGLAP